MRNLKGQDIRPALKFVKYTNIMGELEKVASTTKDVTEMGLKALGIIINKFAEDEKAEKLFLDFLAGPFEKSADEIMQMDLIEIKDGLIELGGLLGLTRFFKSLPK